MGIHGTLTTMSVSDLLQFLATGRKTGTLKFGRGKIVKEIYFHSGLIIGSNTNDPNEYLGQVLIHYGKLNEEQLQGAMEVQRQSGGKLGEILVARKLLSQAEVLEILRVRTLDIIYDLFIWEEAHFEFFDWDPPPADLIRIEVEPTRVIMEGITRVDELGRYRQLIPSDRAVLELAEGWTSSLKVGKEVRQILYLVGKGMSVAEICYQMHASSFHIYAQLYDLVNQGIARVIGEVPEKPEAPPQLTELPKSVAELLWAARGELDLNNTQEALAIIHRALEQEPKNTEAQALLSDAEGKFISEVYKQISPQSVPRLLIQTSGLSQQHIGPEEGFVLSRINGEWDVQSILSICPFREADSLRMIKRLRDNGIIGF